MRAFTALKVVALYIANVLICRDVLYLTLSLLPRFCSCSHVCMHVCTYVYLLAHNVRINLEKLLQSSFAICSEKMTREIVLWIRLLFVGLTIAGERFLCESCVCLLESVESVLISAIPSVCLWKF